MTATDSTAIDIAIEPDATMIEIAERVNAELLAVCDAGFALDETHRPHITTVQAFVRTDDLAELADSVGEIVGRTPLAAWQLRGTGYYYIPWGELGLAGIVIEPTEPVLELQRGLIEAVAPFVVEHADASAFVRTPTDPDINRPTIDYVAAFRAEQVGQRYNPHVTIGVGPQELLDEMVAAPFEGFVFSPSGISIYQLGNLGTAARKLNSWTITPGA